MRRPPVQVAPKLPRERAAQNDVLSRALLIGAAAIAFIYVVLVIRLT